MAELKKAEEGECVTVWVDSKLKGELDLEVRKLGLTRSWVLRYLIKRWIAGRRGGKKANLLEEVGV